MLPELPGLTDIEEARFRISALTKRTPVLTCSSLDALTGREVFLKCENFQKTGSFKFRGACNAVFSLSDEQAVNGVCTHSSGNHAQALSLAARKRGIKAWVVMPDNASKTKYEAARQYGAEIIRCEPNLNSREATLEKVRRRTGAVFIPPYNDPHIIAGQGTAALELLEDHPDLDLVLAPVGGGGLLSGTAIAVRGLKPEAAVIGAEPENADDACRSFREGRLIPANQPDTIADGLRTSLGTLTFAAIRINVDDMVTVSEESILSAMHFIRERMKIVIEPSAAVPVAALLDKKIPGLPGKGCRTGVILSGGNVDAHIFAGTDR